MKGIFKFSNGFYVGADLNNLFEGDFSLGIHTLNGMYETEEGQEFEFYSIIFGFIFFEITIGKEIK